MLLPRNASSLVFSGQGGHGGAMTVSYMAPCSETPIMFLAFLMAILMALSGYWVILKWVAKGNLDLPKLSSVSRNLR